MSIKLILGTMTFGESVFAPDSEAFIQAFLDAGYDELDTAYVYNEGQSEELIGKALKTIGRDRVKLATKVNPRITGRLDGAAAEMQLNESLKRLDTDCADIFYLHFPEPAGRVRAGGMRKAACRGKVQRARSLQFPCMDGHGCLASL